MLPILDKKCKGRRLFREKFVEKIASFQQQLKSTYCIESRCYHGNQFLDIANPVAELVEATIFVSFFLWSFRQAQRPIRFLTEYLKIDFRDSKSKRVSSNLANNA